MKPTSNAIQVVQPNDSGEISNRPSTRAYRYAMVSTEMRRDLNDPLKYFQQLEVFHLYHITPWNDMVAADFSTHNIRYDNARHLYARLVALNPDIVQGVEPFAFRPFPRLLAVTHYVRRHKKPLVVVSLENIPFHKKYGPVSLLMKPFVRRYISAANLLIYINDGARDNFLAHGADPAKTQRLMYGCWGVDVDEFSPVGEIVDELLDGRRIILFVGRIHRVKGVCELLDAFHTIAVENEDVDLVFIGSGPDQDRLTEEARSRRLDDRVHFLGTVKNRELAKYLRRAEFLVAPSQTTWLWAEQIGMVLIQAMAAGLPVITTISGSIAEFVENGETGLLVPEKDADALGLAMNRLLNDRELHEEMASKARRRSVKQYDASRNVQIVERAILESCVPKE